MGEYAAKSFEARSGYAPETCMLIDHLRNGVPGDTVLDEELATVCGLPCRPMTRGYNYLRSAIKYCEQSGVFWKRVKGVQGLRCLTATEKMHVCDSDRKHISRVSRRSLRRLGSIERAELEVSEQRRYDVQLAQHATLALFADHRAEKRIAASTNGHAIERDKVLELFKESTSSRD
jgi:hypothetical protein